MQIDNEKSCAVELTRTENSQSKSITAPAAMPTAETNFALTARFAEQARIYGGIEEQINVAVAESRHAEARALIHGVLETIPLDWQPVQEHEDCLVGAFWDEDEFLDYKNAHPALAKPMVWVPPSPSKLWWLMGGIDVVEGQLDTALICLLNGWEYEPDHPRLWIAKGCALNWLDRFAEALDAYRTAATIRSWTPEPLIANCLHGQGVALGGLGRLAEARDAFTRALEIDPGYEVARRDLVCVLHDLQIMNQRARGQCSPTRLM